MSNEELDRELSSLILGDEAEAFVSEYKRDFSAAIKQHEELIGRLQRPLNIINKKGKLSQVMLKQIQIGLEKQIALSRERTELLGKQLDMGMQDHIAVLPTACAANDELKALKDQGKYSISLIHDDPTLKDTFATECIQPLSVLLPSGAGYKYHMRESHKMVFLGNFIDWMTITDNSDKRVLYELESYRLSETPKTSLGFRRGCNHLRNRNAIDVKAGMAPKGGHVEWHQHTCQTFQGTSKSFPVTEIPARIQKKEDWTPRAFKYGERKFVWLAPEPKLQSRPVHEELWEYTSATTIEGSKTGKMKYETLGSKIAVGKQTTNHKYRYTGLKTEIWIAEGIDQKFREYILCSQATVVTLFYTSFRKPSPGMEKLAGAASGLEAVSNLLSLFG